MTSILPVILSGGSGSRLWPLSRESYPKQFLPLLGERTMLQDTVARLQGLTVDGAVLAAPLLVCNAEHRFLAAGQLQQMGVQGARVLLEPVGRNTAPALTLAALQSSVAGGDPLMVVMPADHVIQNRDQFLQAMRQAIAHAHSGAMVAFGIVPTRADTGYGYIKTGAPAQGGENGFLIDQFAEKPNRETAERYFQSGDYLWNGGIFVVRASVWLKAMRAFRPDIFDACSEAMQKASSDLDFVRPEPQIFSNCPSDSIDYAVMERLSERPELGIAAVVVPMRAGWSDVGAWDALWEVSPQDDQGNVTVGDVLLQESSGSLIYANGRLVAGVGLDDMIVVETDDAVLVARKTHTQSVKKVVEQLKEWSRSHAVQHRKVHRPWGWYDSIDQGSRFQVKRIVVNPGASLSLQMHHHRAEHWIVVRGTAEVTNGEQVLLLSENQSTYIPLGHVHRLRNPGKVPLEIIEVQSGSYLGEDDIVRFEDTYGRIAEKAKP